MEPEKRKFVITIAGHDFDLLMEKDLLSRYNVLGQAKFGTSEDAKSFIAIDASYSQEKWPTILHEIIEVLNKKYDMELTHHQICLLHVTLYETFLRNSKLMSEMVLDILAHDAEHEKEEEEEGPTEDAAK